MPAHLFCKTGEFAGSSYEITNEITIGRGSETVRLPAEVVSGRHARIYFDAERKGYFLEDLQSRNGTKLDGMPVTEPVKLGPLHVVTFADQIDFIYHERAGAATPKKSAPREAEHTQPAGFVPPATPPAPPQAEEDSGTRTQFAPAFNPVPPLAGDETLADDRTLIDERPQADDNQTIRTQAFGSAPLPSAPEHDVQHTHIGPAYTPTPNLPGAGEQPASTPTPIRFSLQITKGGQGETHPLMEGENVVGRAANCSVVLEDNSVSRQHAALIVRDGRVTLKDLGSRNRTFLNGAPIGAVAEVPPGAVIRFGLEIEATLRRA